MLPFKWLDLNFQSPSAWTTTEGSGVRTLWMAPKLRKTVLIYLPHGLLDCGCTALSPTGSCRWKQKFPIQSWARFFSLLQPTTNNSSQFPNGFFSTANCSLLNFLTFLPSGYGEGTALYWQTAQFSRVSSWKSSLACCGFNSEKKKNPVLWFNFL